MRGMSVKQLVAGKHSCIGQLTHLSNASTTGFDEEIHLERPCMLVYCGKFLSMDGEVEVTEAHIDRLIRNHNEKVNKLRALLTDQEDAFVRQMPPIQVDHSTSAHDTVGRMVGLLHKDKFKNADGIEVAACFSDKVRILGKENMERVRDGRWANVSIGADLEAGVLNELSITPFPAAINASLLKRLADEKAALNSKGETMHEKLKKRLMEHHKLSDKDADDMLKHMADYAMSKMGMDDKARDEHLSALAEKPEDFDKMKGEVDEHLKKLSDDVKETEKKLTAARANVVKLAKGFRKELKDVKLASKTVELRARLTGFKAAGKITPAELKKIDFTALAGKPESEMQAVLKSYEDREPVIDPKIHGTTRAVNLAKLEGEAKKARLEAETRLGLGLKLSAQDEKALEEKGPAPAAPAPAGSPAAPAAAAGQNPEVAEYMAHLTKMLEGFPNAAAVLQHVEQMLAQYNPVGETSAAAGADAQQMSALAENVNRLQTQFHDLIALIGDLSGIESAELTE